MSYRAVLATLAREHGVPPLAAEELERWVEAEKEAVTAHLREVLRPDPDVLGPLTALAEHHGLAAVSSSADARIAACFEVTGMAGWFPPERRFSAEDSLPVPTSKPDPAIYTYALHALGLEPAQAVAVEDSGTGATSAVAAGIPTIGNLQFVQRARARGAPPGAAGRRGQRGRGELGRDRRPARLNRRRPGPRVRANRGSTRLCSPRSHAHSRGSVSGTAVAEP